MPERAAELHVGMVALAQAVPARNPYELGDVSLHVAVKVHAT